jgi:hypothetical protein
MLAFRLILFPRPKEEGKIIRRCVDFVAAVL